jgi:acetolactate synthase-1/2/3 large subunit
MRYGANVPQLVLRSLQIAKSAPAGPIYLMGAREVMESEVGPLDLKKVQVEKWKPLGRVALADEVFHRDAKLTKGCKNDR